MTARGRGRRLSRAAGVVIAVSMVFGITSIVLRAEDGGPLSVRLLEASTLLLAALAYLFYVLAHHMERGQVLAAALERVVELGGEVIHPGEQWAICRDSEGSPFGLDSGGRHGGSSRSNPPRSS